MSTISAADSTEIYYEDIGKGQPIVFIHGWPLSGAMWEYQVVPLVKAGFRCISYDRRGFGRSGKSSTSYDYATLGSDLATLIDKLELRDITLVGFSMGGGEVIEYLSRHNSEGRVTKAALVSSIVPYLLKTDDNPDGVEAKAFTDMQDGLRKDRPGFLTDFTEKFFGVGMLSSPVSMPMIAACCEVAMTASPIATIECVKTFSHTDFRAKAKMIRVPTLVIHGDADQTVPIKPTGRSAAELMPSAELKVYSGAPHGLFFTNKDELNQDLVAFVSEGRQYLEAAE